MEKLEELKNTNLHNRTMELVEELLPKWVEGVAKKYAEEYDELTKSWDKLCEKVKTQKQYILIVKYLPLANKSENDQYINLVSDLLVSKGYLLRRTSELIICPNTGDALLTKKMFDYFKRHNGIFPDKWLPVAKSSYSESDGDINNSRSDLESSP